MIDAILNCDDVENELYIGGDGIELINDVTTIMAAAYASLLTQCSDCASLFREALTNSKAVNAVFEDVYNDFLNDPDKYTQCIRYDYDDEEYDDYDYEKYENEKIKYSSNLDAWKTQKLFGFDELKKRGKNNANT